MAKETGLRRSQSWALGVACLLSALWNFPSGCTGLDRLGFLTPRCGGSGCWLFQLSRGELELGDSPPSVSRDGGACLGTAGVTQSLKGGLNRNSKPQSPAGSLPSALNHHR